MMTTDKVFRPALPEAEVDPETAATEAGPTPDVQPPRLARGYVPAVHPDTGLDVVFVPGEALPAWAVEPNEAEEQPDPKPTRRRGSAKAIAAAAAAAGGRP